jgi:hypothetical protein
MAGWSPPIQRVIVGKDDRAYFVRDLIETAWLAGQGRTKFKKEGE